VKDIAIEIKNNISNLSWMLDSLKYNKNSAQFFYDNYTIYNNITSIDVSSFNLNFLIFINPYVKYTLSPFIDKLSILDKQTRVIKFGLLFRELNSVGLNIRDYLVSFRNLIFSNFFDSFSYSQKSIILYRMNFDDIEFFSINKNSTAEPFVGENFLNIVKYNNISNVIVLNRNDGIFYINDNKIIDIKYTSGWVNIPVYRILLTKVVNFVLDKNKTLEELNKEMLDIIDNMPPEDMFGYDECQISKAFKSTDITPRAVKNLFISNIMSKFVMLINRI